MDGGAFAAGREDGDPGRIHLGVYLDGSEHERRPERPPRGARTFFDGAPGGAHPQADDHFASPGPPLAGRDVFPAPIRLRYLYADKSRSTLPCAGRAAGLPRRLVVAQTDASASHIMNWAMLRQVPWLDTRARFVAGTPRNGALLDLGSSDGETLGHFAELRPDLRLFAVDKAGEP